MIVPEKKNIEEILGGNRVKYSVPNYQRSYDWGKGELQELMDDLSQIKSDDENNLFLGNRGLHQNMELLISFKLNK